MNPLYVGDVQKFNEIVSFLHNSPLERTSNELSPLLNLDVIVGSLKCILSEH